jgi:lipid-A-disaccharide synthase
LADHEAQINCSLIGLPNILCGEFVVPELLQSEATPEALAAEVMRWLMHGPAPDTSSPSKQNSTRLHHELQRDTAQLATDAIQKNFAEQVSLSWDIGTCRRCR